MSALARACRNLGTRLTGQTGIVIQTKCHGPVERQNSSGNFDWRCGNGCDSSFLASR